MQWSVFLVCLALLPDVSSVENYTVGVALWDGEEVAADWKLMKLAMAEVNAVSGNVWQLSLQPFW